MQNTINAGKTIERGLDMMAEVSVGRGVLVQVLRTVMTEIISSVIHALLLCHTFWYGVQCSINYCDSFNMLLHEYLTCCLLSCIPPCYVCSMPLVPAYVGGQSHSPEQGCCLFIAGLLLLLLAVDDAFRCADVSSRYCARCKGFKIFILMFATGILLICCPKSIDVYTGALFV